MSNYGLVYSCLISLNKQNIFDAWLHVKEYQNNCLRDACLAFSAQNFEWLIEQGQFGMREVDDFFDVLKNSFCEVDDRTRYESIFAWRNLQRSPKPSVEQLKQLLATIDWADLPVTDLFVDLDDRNLR